MVVNADNGLVDQIFRLLQFSQLSSSLTGGKILGTLNLPSLATNSIFSVSFCKKIIILPGAQINDPSSGTHSSLPFLPATPSSLSRTLEGLFELTRRPSRALASCVASGTKENRTLLAQIENI